MKLEILLNPTKAKIKRPKGTRSRAEVLREIHERRKVKRACELCGKWIAGYRMKVHVERVHQKIKKFTCDRCGKMFYNKQTLEDHLRAEFGVRTVECQYCGKKLPSTKAKLTHIYANHERKFERTCEICKESFNTKIKYDSLSRVATFSSKIK
jgi:hypothetical protein